MSSKCSEDNAWEFIRAASAVINLKAADEIPREAILTPEQQLMVESFSYHSGMNAPRVITVFGEK
jgi:hypothetical protein